ncbi:hypothetical protein FLGE108171_13270 [Flavobacterium gelidilacus]|uniref:hypothetical protein n=1 Tax=Flavobacterium gelidilacus TaxID=206041 RepID=UPI00041002E5|nr:hypothetical protein [Flavobacterium gelidilacus]
MKKIIFIIVITSILFSFCVSKPKEEELRYRYAYCQDICIDKENSNKEVNNYIGIFPNKNDTITIYKLEDKLTKEESRTLFWHTKNYDAQNITFYNSENDSVKVRFENNSIYLNNDSYELNNEYFNFLKKKVLEENSILDLAFLVKEGIGDYTSFFELLNKNWRNQTENKSYKIISAKISNKNYQTDDQFFKYTMQFNYNNEGLVNIFSKENSYTKTFISEDNKHIHYSIKKTINERASIDEELYINKETTNDSIIGAYEQYSNAKTTHYIKYQSKLKELESKTELKSLAEIIKTLELK